MYIDHGKLISNLKEICTRRRNLPKTAPLTSKAGCYKALGNTQNDELDLKGKKHQLCGRASLISEHVQHVF